MVAVLAAGTTPVEAAAPRATQATVTAARHDARASARPRARTKPYVHRISRNGRYFLDQRGRPILVKGDSPWAILVDASVAKMNRYVAIRSRQGFNAALVSLLGNTANGGPSDSGATYDGVRPFVGGDPSRLNGRYWDRVANFMRRCLRAGITVMAYPLDGWTGTPDHDGLAQSWSTAQARAYGRAVAHRLRRFPNVVWAVGGDFSSARPDVDPRFNAVLKGLARGGMKRPSTIQFTLNQTSFDSPYWARRIGFSFAYAYAPSYTIVQSSYQRRTPAHRHVPTIMGEAHYEDYPGVTNLYLRSQAAWALTSGAAGDFYGSEDVWDAAPTRRHLRTRAVGQLSALRRVFGRLPGWPQLVPDFASRFIRGGRGDKGSDDGEYYSGNTYVTGGITRRGTLAVVYLPDAARAVTLATGRMRRGYTAHWVDPTNGARHAARTGTTYRRARANAAGGPDWLLVLQARVRR